MTSKQTAVQMTVQVDVDEDVHPEQLDNVTRQLLGELRDVRDIESTELVGRESVPDDVRSGVGIELGALAISLLPHAVPLLIDFLRDWCMRGEKRSVKVKAQTADHSVELEYNPTTMSIDEVKELVQSLTAKMTSVSQRSVGTSDGEINQTPPKIGKLAVG
ncbi:MAG: hypothetical protein O7I42_17920 [Alphaproteobacteria bacterium]|nr:hypothetical protein [Alphaproteobacteria bacterium]